MPHYISKKGKRIELRITTHAKLRFIARWNLLHGKTPVNVQTAEAAIARLLDRADRLECLGRKYQTRLKRHGKDTLYFAGDGLVLVIQDAALITVELAGKARLANRRPELLTEG